MKSKLDLRNEFEYKFFVPTNSGTQFVFINGEQIQGKWKAGSLLFHTKVQYSPLDQVDNEENTELFGVYDGFSDWNFPVQQYKADIIPETISRPTNKRDNNGKLIYENDIICLDDKVPLIVVWDDKNYQWGCSPEDNPEAIMPFCSVTNFKKVTIVGNRFSTQK